MAHLHTHIAEVTGSEPVTCPWRVYNDPVVSAGRQLLTRLEKGIVDLDRQLAVVVDAAETIGGLTAHLSVLDMRAKRAAREADARIEKAGRQ